MYANEQNLTNTTANYANNKHKHKHYA